MTTAMLRTLEPGSPSEADIEAAQVASRALAHFSGDDSVHVEVVGEAGTRQSFVLPATAVRLLTDVLAGLAEGRTVVIMQDNKELTTQHAADMLNVSRPYLIRLLQEEKIAYHKVGTHRRIFLRDLQAYREAQMIESAALLDELVAEAQELDMGY